MLEKFHFLTRAIPVIFMDYSLVEIEKVFEWLRDHGLLQGLNCVKNAGIYVAENLQMRPNIKVPMK